MLQKKRQSELAKKVISEIIALGPMGLQKVISGMVSNTNDAILYYDREDNCLSCASLVSGSYDVENMPPWCGFLPLYVFTAKDGYIDMDSLKWIEQFPHLFAEIIWNAE